MTDDVLRLHFTVDEIDERGLNARDGHWADRLRAEQSIHMVVRNRAHRLHPGVRLERAAIWVIRHQTTQRRRDPDNLAATAKPMIDGLVQAGLLPDDGHRHVTEVTLQVDAGAGVAGWSLVVTPRTDRARRTA